MEVQKSFNGKKYQYKFNGKVVKNSTREYHYACIATPKKAKGATKDGEPKVISFGNKKESTYNSMARFYYYCDIEVITIK